MAVLKEAGLIRKALLEFLALLSIIVIFDTYLLDGSRFLSSSYHPFWIPILLIAVQYGSTYGVISAALCTSALYLFNMPPYLPSEDHFAYWERISLLPLLWFSVAVILGEISSRQRAEKRFLDQELSESRQRENILVKNFEQLEREKRAIERSIAGLIGTPAHILNIINQCNIGDQNSISASAHRLIQSVIKAKKHSLFQISGRGLELFQSEGWAHTLEFPNHYSKESELYKALLRAKGPLSVTEGAHEKLLKKHGVFICPIFSYEDQNELVGMIKIEQIDLWDLHISSIAAACLIAQWSGMMFDLSFRLTVESLSASLSVHGNLSATNIALVQKE